MQNPADTSRISHLGRYEIIQELGRGAMGIVYKAKDPLIERMVAIKSINLHELDAQQREEYQARFYQEAKAAGRLSHPNIVTIYDLGESGDTAYIAMELMEGRELHNLIATARLPLDRALSIAIQTAEGLAFAHRHGIVHRDIKPSNIMVLGDDHIKIADFGIAKMDSSMSLTRVGLIMGSPLYMSPEQVKGTGVDARSDIFSLGIVLYELLTGLKPFTGENVNAVMYQIVNEPPRKPGSINPEISPSLEMAVLKCLEKNPEDRYQNASELSQDLRSCQAVVLQAKGLHGQKHHKLMSDVMLHTNKAGRKKLAIIALFGAILLIAIFELIEQTIEHFFG
jgi:serine/threonine protein kinase